MEVGIMTIEKGQQEANMDGIMSQPQEPQRPDQAQDHASQNGMKPTKDQGLPADLIQVEGERGYAWSSQLPILDPSVLTSHDYQTTCTEKVMSPPAKNPHMEMPPIVSEPEPQMVTPLSRLTATPTFIDCPFCLQRTQTNVSTEGTSMQTIAAALCCLFCLCAVCLPYLCHWFEDTHIYCSR